jgi:L-asparaginase
MPRVRVLATGGTIAGEGASATDLRYRPGSLGVEGLLGSVRGLAALADVSGEQVAQIGSQDMDDVRWLQIAARANALLREDAADGIVVTHGTDSMEETAYFLHLTVKSDRPVVLTGAMRAATSLSPDGPLNLYNAVAVAADPGARGRGVFVVMNDDLHGARDVTKAHTSDVQAFVSPGPGLLGTATYGRIRYFRRPSRDHTLSSPFSVEGCTELPRVDVLYAHAGMSPDLVGACVERGARGLVVAGMGNGNVTAAAARALAEAVRAGVAVVRSTRLVSGDVGRNVELDDDRLGFVAADQLNPQKARVLLKLGLAQGLAGPALQDAFDRY